MSELYSERAHLELMIESWSSTARELLLRGFTKGGPFAETHTTSADRSKATDTYQLHGYPEGMTVTPAVAPVRRGETYVRITLMMDGEPILILSSAYVTDSKPISWPDGDFESSTDGAGFIRLITGTNPAAGATISETVPTNARWKIKTLTPTLVTDATVTNRTTRIVVDDGTTEFFTTRFSPNQAASETQAYHFIPGFGMLETTLSAGFRFGAMPELYLFQGWRIRSSTINFQAGDNWGAPVIMVEEWIEE